MSYKIFIDKISLTARLIKGIKDGHSPLTDYLNGINDEVEFRHMPWNFIYQYQYNLKREGFFIQIGRFEQSDVFRIEFNPNKLDKEKVTSDSVFNENKVNPVYSPFRRLHDILSFVSNPNITRIDWAIDYEKDLSTKDLKLRNARKAIEYRSRSGKLETKYLGSPKSDKFIRVYNKALEKRVNKNSSEEEEVKVNETLWRVESVVKDFSINVVKPVRTMDSEGNELIEEQNVKYDYLFQNPFTEIAIYQKTEMYGSNLKISEKAMLHYLEQFPEEWDSLSRPSRKKYEALKYCFGYELMENQPVKVFEKEKNRLADELRHLLKPVLDNTQNTIGKISNLHYSLEYLEYQQTGKVEKQPKLNDAELYYLQNKEEIAKDFEKLREEMNKDKSHVEFEGKITRVDSENNKGYKEWLEWIEKLD